MPGRQPGHRGGLIMKKKDPNLKLLILALGTAALIGCEAFNDNPVSADKMNQIRKKEAAQRSTYNPSTTTKPGG